MGFAALYPSYSSQLDGRVKPGHNVAMSLLRWRQRPRPLRAAQTLIAYKRGRHDIWAANLDYTIRLGASPLEDRIGGKVVRLVDGADAVPAAGFLL